MLDELRQILAQEGITTAAIVDDVFDDTPTSRDIEDGPWDIFLDDQTDSEITLIKDRYKINEPESRWEELRNDDNFIKFLWDHRGDSDVFQALFFTFSEHQSSGRAQLEKLRTLLFEELKLQGQTYGRQADVDPDTQLLFVDLFLGTQQDEEARNRALRLVKDIVEPRPESPPMLVLISSSTRLTEMRDEFRDEAGLIGCQFRTMQKTELDDATALHEILYRLITSYRQSLKLSGFLALWRQALNDATIRFFKRVRRLDLRDYADLQTLVLNAEGELVGAYLLEVFGQYFQFELEEDTRLSSSAVDLNQLRWDNYAPPHFLPASDSASIADGMLFRSSKIFAKTDPLQFGDVLFSTRVDALGAEEEPIADFGKGERIALLALTAACDLQHENATRFLFIAGVAKPSELILHKRPTPQLTPILIVDGKHYVVQWEIGAPVAMSENDFKDKIDSGVFIRVRRFRPLFSLQLQQLFTSSLSRVGTMVMPPAQHLAGVVISYRDQNRILRQLISLQPIDGKAVILVGRGVKDFIDKLILGPEVVSELRIAVNKVDVNTLNQNERQKWQSAVHTRELYSKMEEGIPFSREGLKAPFTGTTYDIVTVIGPYVKESPINADRVISGNANLLVIELKVSDQS